MDSYHNNNNHKQTDADLFAPFGRLATSRRDQPTD